MANPYGKFITAIDDFESMSQLIIKECAEFMKMSTLVGAEVGGAIKTIAKLTLRTVSGNNPIVKIGLRFATKYSIRLFTGIGAGIGHLHKKSQYKKACAKILSQGKEYKRLSLELVPATINILQRGIQAYNDCLIELKNTICEDRIRDDYTIEGDVKTIKNSIKNLYQLEYRFSLAEKITDYFSDFEKELEENNLEAFSRWYQDDIFVNKLQCYSHCYNKVYSLLTENIDDEQLLAQINEDFEIINGSAPILTLSNSVCTTKLMEEICKFVYAEKTNTSFEKTLPSFYYKYEGFNKMKEVVKTHFENNVLPKYKRNRKLMLILPATVLSIVYLIINNSFDLERPYLALVVFVVALFVSIPIIRKMKSNMYDMMFLNCSRMNGDEFIEKIMDVSLEYADKEMNVRESEYDKLFGEPPAIARIENDEAEDKMLQAIIKTGKVG